MATWPHRAAKYTTVVLQEGLHTGSEGGAGFTSRGLRSSGGRASRTALAKTGCVKGGTHSKYVVLHSKHAMGMRLIAAFFGPCTLYALTSHVSVFSHYFKRLKGFTKLATSSEGHLHRLVHGNDCR